MKTLTLQCCRCGKTFERDIKQHRDALRKGLKRTLCSIECRDLPIPLDVRFWKFVQVGDSEECWPWIGNVSNAGYGYISIGSRTTTVKSAFAHRIAWELTHGPIPIGKGHHGTCVCHHCDNRRCCNPAHLFLADHAGNMRDMVDKGRSRTIPCPGETNPRAKLTDAAVVRIRTETGHSDVYWARFFGVSSVAVRHARIGSTWRHLPMAL